MAFWQFYGLSYGPLYGAEALPPPWAAPTLAETYVVFVLIIILFLPPPPPQYQVLKMVPRPWLASRLESCGRLPQRAVSLDSGGLFNLFRGLINLIYPPPII